tara:strand:- start:207 stop:731 length:525 start_codon:yes stop_codon:yes gene_type:complete
MKKITLILFLLFSISSYSQWGLTAGFSSGEGKVSSGNTSVTSDFTGYGLGVVYEEVHSETLKFDSVLSYGSYDSEGTDDRSGQLNLGTTLKLYTNPESGFHLRGGVVSALSLEEKVEDFSQFGVGASIGIGFDISEEVTLTAAISTTLTEQYTGTLDIDTSSGGFGVALIYRLK